MWHIQDFLTLQYNSINRQEKYLVWVCTLNSCALNSAWCRGKQIHCKATESVQPPGKSEACSTTAHAPTPPPTPLLWQLTGSALLFTILGCFGCFPLVLSSSVPVLCFHTFTQSSAFPPLLQMSTREPQSPTNLIPGSLKKKTLLIYLQETFFSLSLECQPATPDCACVWPTLSAKLSLSLSHTYIWCSVIIAYCMSQMMYYQCIRRYCMLRVYCEL